VSDKFLSFSRGAWGRLEEAVRKKLALSGFDKSTIDWVCRDMAVRWNRLPPSKDGPVVTTLEEHAGEVQRAVNAVQAANNETLLEFANMMLDLEIDLYYSLYPPRGGTRLRLVA
jgi:hypothetical protein